MQLTLATAALAFLPAILAAPTTSLVTKTIAPIEGDLAKRANYGVYLCNDRNWSGYCQHIVAPASVCVPLASDLNDLVSSAGPDVGSFCYFFVDAGCSTSGDFFHVGNPGYGDLSKVPVNGPAGSTRNYEDKLSSYFCVAA